MQLTNDWFDLIFNSLKIDFSNRKLAKSIAESVLTLHHAFTKSKTRPRKMNVRSMHRLNLSHESLNEILQTYPQYPDFQTGYGAYYLLINIQKILNIFDRHHICPSRFDSILDIGVGPGTALASAMIYAASSEKVAPRIDVCGVDKSAAFLKLAGDLIHAVKRKTGIDGVVNLKKLDILRNKDRVKEKYKLVIASNFLAELAKSDAEKTLNDYILPSVDHEGILLFVEPATKSFSRNLIEIRDGLCHSGWTVRAPCPGGFDCPAFQSTGDWCHDRIAWQAPELLTRINSYTGLGGRSISYTYFLMQKSDAGSTNVQPSNENSGDWMRVVSDLMISKGKVEFFVCDTGRKLRAVIMKRNVQDHNQNLIKIKRYDRVLIKHATISDDQLLLDAQSLIIVLQQDVRIC